MTLTLSDHTPHQHGSEELLWVRALKQTQSFNGRYLFRFYQFYALHLGEALLFF